MQCFEQTFCVSPKHRLEQVRSRARAGVSRTVSWEHVEYDTRGECVARYESFEEVQQAAPRRSGWRKFSPDGRLIACGQTLPIGIDEMA